MMSKKGSNVARSRGRGNITQAGVPPAPMRKGRARKSPPAAAPADADFGPTTRKTIEVPEGYFRRIKIRAVERGMLEKELWAEIVGEYFRNHPTA